MALTSILPEWAGGSCSGKRPKSKELRQEGPQGILFYDVGQPASALDISASVHCMCGFKCPSSGQDELAVRPKRRQGALLLDAAKTARAARWALMGFAEW